MTENDKKKEMVWNSIESCSNAQFDLMIKDDKLSKYMMENSPKEIMRKGFNIGFGYGFTLALACLNIGYNDIKSIDLFEKNITLEKR